MSVRINLEIGHEASVRTKRTLEGYTHDWEVFVRGCDGADVQNYIEKVVFYLHETFQKPKRVIKEPPYSVKESGYAGFNFPIDIYFRNKDEPKKIKFNYDLNLQPSGPAIKKVQKEKYVFHNVNDDFKFRLLKGGGMVVSASSVDSSDVKANSEEKNQLLNKPKLGGSEMPKKHKMKMEDPRNPSFTGLFGQPIKKMSKPEVKPIVKEAFKSSSSNKEKEKSKNKSPSKDKDRDREKMKDKGGEERKSKDKDKSKDRNKERDRSKEKKRDKSPRPRSPSPKRPRSPKQRPPSPKRMASPLPPPPPPIKHEEKRPENKEKKEEKKYKKEKRDKEKEYSDNKYKESNKSEHKPVKEIKKEIPREKEPSPAKMEKKEKPKEAPKEIPVIKEEEKKHKHKKKDKEKREKKDERHKKQLEKPKEVMPKEIDKSSLFSSPKHKPLNALFSEIENENSTSSVSSKEEPTEAVVEKVVPEIKQDLFEVRKKEPEKKEKAKKKEKKRDKEKRKRKADSKAEDEPEVKAPREESDGEQTSSQQSRDLDKENQENPEEYMKILRELQHKIMTLQDNAELQRVVQLIAETGRYEVSARTFDFDLCLLERSTVRRLQEFFSISS